MISLGGGGGRGLGTPSFGTVHPGFEVHPEFVAVHPGVGVIQEKSKKRLHYVTLNLITFIF